MRILFIHNAYRQYGGEDVAVELETALLKEKGHDVSLVHFTNEGGGMAAAWNAIYNRASARKARAAIRAFRPDIVHVHNWFFEASPAVLFAAAKEKVPVVMTLHNYRMICANALLLRNNIPCELCVPHTFPLYGVRYKCYRGSAAQSALVTAVTGIHKSRRTWQQKVDRYIVLTAFAGSRFEGSSFNVPPEKMIVKPNFITDPGEGPAQREDFFLFAGRLSKEKGVHILVQAFAGLPAHKLVIVGDGPEKDILQARHATATNITFAGKRTRNELLEMMKRCKALIFPSIWYEGLPFTILEAFATGTPVIASKLGSMSELVTEGYNGSLFTAGDITALQEKVMTMAQEGPATAAMYHNARQTYLDNYHPEIHYKSIISIYEQTIANSKSPHAGTI
jgi:glycosyltransferase involved in cell wall biosynthesis